MYYDTGFESAWVTVLMFPIGVIPWCYACSFLFTNDASAQAVMMFVNLAGMLILNTAISIFRVSPDTEILGDNL